MVRFERRAAVIVFPILSALISALCAVVIAGDARRRPRPDKLAWAFAFVMFALIFVAVSYPKPLHRLDRAPAGLSMGTR